MKRIAAVTAMVIAVTIGGVMAGAFLVSPLAATKPWVLPTVAGIAIVTVMAMLTVWLEPATTGATVRIGRNGSAPDRGSASPTSLPAFSRANFARSGRIDRTPKAVQALAEAGTALTEIARRTGLAVDAVSLLLAMSTASRQVPPPTA